MFFFFFFFSGVAGSGNRFGFAQEGDHHHLGGMGEAEGC